MNDTNSKVISAGILLFRRANGEAQVFLVHPGGPFFAKKDDGVWSIPKGVRNDGEDSFAAALREFQEETGLTAAGHFIALGELRQPSGKIVMAWAVEQDADPASIKSETFDLEWPPKSGQTRAFPEVDRAAWLSLDDARVKLLKGQVGFLDRLATIISLAGAQRRGSTTE